MDQDTSDKINSINCEADLVRILTKVIYSLVAGMCPDLSALEIMDLLKILNERTTALKQRTRNLTEDLNI